MHRLAQALFAALLGLSAPALADQNPVVVELFTSQGCSSCPPADAILAELAPREDVIALALHVDYWDYIGWKDPYGDPGHADRQRAYAYAGQRHSVYTPETVVQGQTDILGSKPMALAKAIAEHAKAPVEFDLRLSRQGSRLRIEATGETAPAKPLEVHLLRYIPSETTHIKRGENAGKTVEYANIVHGWQLLGHWDGTAPLTLTQAIEGDDPVVVILQDPMAGPIRAAARLR